MTEFSGDESVMRVAGDAFIQESGGALIRKYTSLGDDLFTEAGYRHFADDLLERMTNPYLADSVARASRDVVRKLGVNDRIFGTMALAVEQGIEPKNMAIGAMAGVTLLLANAAEYGVPEIRDQGPGIRGQGSGFSPLTPDTRPPTPERLAQFLAKLWQTPITPALQQLVDHTCAARGPLGKVLVP
jgi:hypothetical protein